MHRDPFTLLTLLGTDRLAAPPPAPHPVLADAWSRLDWTARESAALSAMALLATARTAGAPLTTDAQPDSEPAPAEMLPACPPPAAALLRRMLAGEYPTLLPDWLALAATHGFRARFAELPALLRALARDRSLRTVALPVLGQRGLWLARRHDDWRPLLETAAVPDDAWDTGDLTTRLAWLRQTRATDPARAASALATAWPAASGEERERFAALVAQSPSPHDAPLLETDALRDRRREVRASARAALLRLPDTAAAQRAREHAANILRLDPASSPPRLVAYPPENYDSAWKTDAIDEKPPAGTGPRAHWTRQWLAAVPLSFWTRHFDVSAETLFALNRDDEWCETVLLGWIDAATAAPEPANAEAFARHLLALDAWPKTAPAPHVVLLALLGALEAANDTDACARILAATPTADDSPLYFDLLFRSAFALPATTARDAVERCLAAFQAKPYPRLQSNHARDLARRLPLDVAADTLGRVATLPDLSSPTEELLRALEFRLHVHQALTTSTAAT